MFEGGALGNYSLAGFEMVLVRHVMHYIINYYLPSGLFVVVSWISFLVPAEVLPGKKVSTGPEIITCHGSRETGWKKIAFTCLLWLNKPQINYPISSNP